MSRKIRVLVVDDNKMFRDLVADQLNDSNIEATAVGSGEEALRSLCARPTAMWSARHQHAGPLRPRRAAPDQADGGCARSHHAHGRHLALHGLEAMRLGAYDYLTKPATLDEMEAVIRKADEKSRLVRQNASLRSVVRQPAAADDEAPAFVYQSEQCAASSSWQKVGRAPRFDRHHHRRDRDRQRCARALHSRPQRAQRIAAHHGQLRRDARNALRVGILRPREGRVYGRKRAQARPD